MNKKIIIYTQQGCLHCTKLKELFDKNEIKYVEKDKVEHHEEWVNVHSILGLATLPTIYFKDNYFIPGRDYNTPEQLIQMIKSQDKFDTSNELRSKEAMKTLIYSINQGFGRMFNEIKQLKDEYKKSS